MLNFLKELPSTPGIREAMAGVSQREENSLPVTDFSSGNVGKIVNNLQLFSNFQIEVNKELIKPLRIISEAIKKGLLSSFYPIPDGLPYSPTGGTDSAKILAMNYFRKFHGLPLSDDNLERVIVTAGGQQALSASIKSIKSGTTIFMPRWEYSPVPELVKFNECQEKRIPISDDLSFDVNFLKDIIKNDSVLYLSMPNNPTGYTSPKDLGAISEIMLKNDGGVIWDAPYIFTILRLSPSKAIYDKKFQNEILNDFKEIASEYYDNMCILSSLSKTCLLTGLRLGLATGPSKWIRSMNTIISRDNISSPTTSFLIGIEALKLFINEPITHEWLCELVANRLTMLIEEELPLILPKNGAYGAFYAIVRTKGMDGIKFSNELVKKFGIVTIPGNAFYGDEIDAVRVSLVTTPWSEDEQEWARNVRMFKKALE
ncbi:MAG: pyridoxal phosphate-dependent aminotransferase [Candidatus Bathyarchaeota archaeon]|nr:pyridoxal phosphate-dependent aminotransferase [Candidatus Bathyarchaeota archaeon]